MLGLQVFGQNDRHFTAGKMAEVDLRKAELDVVGGNGDIAAGDHGESAAKHPAVDFGDYRLRHLA